MPRISSQAGKSLANIALKRTIVDYPFTGQNISASASRWQLGGGERIANTSTWTFTNNTVTFVGTGLPYHSFGNSEQGIQSFGESINAPGNQNFNISWTYRGGQRVASPGTKLNDGLIGIWLNGVSMYNPSAQWGPPTGFTELTGYTYNAGYQAVQELGYNFGQDSAGGHISPPNRYHYHDGSFFDAWILGNGWKSGTYGSTGLAECSLINYLKDGLTHADGHSKILGIAADGYPVYGPYGYNVALNKDSGVDRMVSGYKLYPTSNRIGT
jgi:hypothetical protein